MWLVALGNLGAPHTLGFIPPTPSVMRLPPLLARPVHHSSSSENDASAAQPPSSPGSLRELLIVLDDLGIRYPPEASRYELEQLWRREWVRQTKQQTARQIWTEHSESTTAPVAPQAKRKSTRKGLKEEYPQRWSLGELVEKLDEQNIRYSPTATREDLEFLWNTRARPVDSVDPIFTNRQSDAIPRDPSKSANEEIVTSVDPTFTNGQSDTIPRDPSKSANRDVVTPIDDLIKELDRQSLRYPPTATRADLEDILNSTPQPSPSPSRYGRQPKDPDLAEKLRKRASRSRQQELEMSSWQRALQHSQRTISNVLLESLPAKVDSATKRVSSKASRAADRAARRARQVSRQAKDYFTVDENGVRDVPFQYVYQEERPRPINIRFRPVDTDMMFYRASPTLRPRARPRPPSSSPSGRPHTPTSGATAATTAQSSPLFRGVPRLLPVSSAYKEGSFSQPPPSSNPGSHSSEHGQRKNRKVYSPYSKDNIWDEKDAFDRFGDFLADTADKVMWGKYDLSQQPSERGADRQTAEPESKTPKPHSKKQSPAEYRHWKDRLEERFDTMLGIHEKGEYYKKWTDREIDDHRQESGGDVFSFARGEQLRRNRRSKQQKYEKPIWEEEGSLISLLFGRTPAGGSLLYEKLLDTKSGSILNVFRAGAKSFLLVGSYLCRWASVRGALPQPVVVLGVFTAGICAHPRRRLRTVAISLIVLRTVGELLHGYLVGDQEWNEDDASSDSSGSDYEGAGM
jgi:hypothetical protein